MTDCLEFGPSVLDFRQGYLKLFAWTWLLLSWSLIDGWLSEVVAWWFSDLLTDCLGLFVHICLHFMPVTINVYLEFGSWFPRVGS